MEDGWIQKGNLIGTPESIAESERAHELERKRRQKWPQTVAELAELRREQEERMRRRTFEAQGRFDWRTLPNPPPGTCWRVGDKGAALVKHGDLLGPQLPFEQWPGIDKE
jgi:hypothetical protein